MRTGFLQKRRFDFSANRFWEEKPARIFQIWSMWRFYYQWFHVLKKESLVAGYIKAHLGKKESDQIHPPRSTLEPENDGLEDVSPCSRGVLSGSMLIFPGVSWETCVKFYHSPYFAAKTTKIIHSNLLFIWLMKLLDVSPAFSNRGQWPGLW